jgi:hypothetical protein
VDASRRYALTDKPDSVDWRRLGIQPSGYALTDTRGHDALSGGIAAWAKRASMGLLEHRSYIADLLDTAPSDVPEEVSYLENVVRDPDTTPFFTEYAGGAEWLHWLTGAAHVRFTLRPGCSDYARESSLGELVRRPLRNGRDSV